MFCLCGFSTVDFMTWLIVQGAESDGASYVDENGYDSAGMFRYLNLISFTVRFTPLCLFNLVFSS